MLRKGDCCEFDRLLFVWLLSTLYWALSCIWCNYKSISAPQFPPVQVSCLSASTSTRSLLTHLRAGWQQRTFAAMTTGLSPSGESHQAMVWRGGAMWSYGVDIISLPSLNEISSKWSPRTMFSQSFGSRDSLLWEIPLQRLIMRDRKAFYCWSNPELILLWRKCLYSNVTSSFYRILDSVWKKKK